LFGEDIRDLFAKLNKSYAWLSAYGDGPAGMTRQQWAQRNYDHMMFIGDTAGKLPELFRAYMYFGDYKRDL
jgi:hypothetical protein